MTATTLAIATGPTLRDGLAELLHIAEAVAATDDCGVTIERDSLGQLVDAYADGDVAPGVIITETAEPIDPWRVEVTGQRWIAAAARRELLEVLAHVTTGDIVATADAVQLVPSCGHR